MDNGHSLVTKMLGRFWEKNAAQMSAFETLHLIDWCDQYLQNLRDFGIRDVFL